MMIEMGQAFDGGIVDYIEVEPYGIVRIVGWSRDSRLPSYRVTAADAAESERVFRRPRPDVAEVLRSDDGLLGFSIEFLFSVEQDVLLEIGGMSRTVRVGAAPDGHPWVPEYKNLLNGEQVLHREDIYLSGLPVDWVHPDIWALARRLDPPILDFGCGNGVLVRCLRQSGKEAYGIELNREAIRTSIQPDVAGHIRLYDGRFPLPFPDGYFESAIATEVIEHVPEFEIAISEIARVCRSSFAITVPDMSCIPIGSRHGVVPFHLLESTHVNFFNHRSLDTVLLKSFPNVTFFQLASGRVNGDFMPGSLAAIASKGPLPRRPVT